MALPTLPGNLEAQRGRPSDGRFVLLIQDAHHNLSVQKNIALFLNSLSDSIDFIGIEGSSGKYELDSFRNFRSKSAEKRAFTYLLENDFINGAEYHALSSPREVPVFGLETPALYRENAEARRRAADARARVLEELDHSDVELSRRAAADLSPSQRSFEADVARYRSGVLSTVNFLRRLKKTIPLTDTGAALEEIDRAIVSARAALSGTSAQKDLLAALDDAWLVRRLVGEDLTAFEWKRYRRAHPASEKRLQDFERFYEAASNRNAALADNILKSAGTGRFFGVAVVGGFHTRALQDLLAQRGVSSAIFVPGISSSHLMNTPTSLPTSPSMPLLADRTAMLQEVFVAVYAAAAQQEKRITPADIETEFRNRWGWRVQVGRVDGDHFDVVFDRSDRTNVCRVNISDKKAPALSWITPMKLPTVRPGNMLLALKIRLLDTMLLLNIFPKDTVRITREKLEHRYQFDSDPEVVALAPGRLNQKGEHVDYPEGFEVPGASVAPDFVPPRNYSYAFAMPSNILVSGSKNGTGTVRVYARNFRRRVEFDIEKIKRIHEMVGEAEVEKLKRSGRWNDLIAEHFGVGSDDFWATYILGALYIAIKRGYPLSGCDLVIEGDVPIGGGVSSSAALEVGITMTGQKLFGWPLDDKTELALFAREAENRYYNPFTNAACGYLDQISLIQGEPNRAVLIDYGNIRNVKKVALNLGQWGFVVATSQAERHLGKTAYDDRRLELQAAALVMAPLLKQALASRNHEMQPRGHVSAYTFAELAMIESEFDDAEKFVRVGERSVSWRTLYNRAYHVIKNKQETLEYAMALRNGEVEKAGALLNEEGDRLMMTGKYQISGTLDVDGKSINASDILVGIMRDEGAYARMEGGGGNDTSIGLVKMKGFFGWFRFQWWKWRVARRYYQATGLRVKFFDGTPSDGARIVYEKPHGEDGSSPHGKGPKPDGARWKIARRLQTSA